MGIRPAVTYTIGILCIILLIVSIALLVANVFLTIVQNYVKKEVQLRNGTVAFENWENPPPPIYMQFYFFNVTNPGEVLDGGKPFLEEKGPYTYREYNPKENVTFVEDGKLVSAMTPKTYVFVPELSAGDPETDLIRTVNIPVVLTGLLVRAAKRVQVNVYVEKIGGFPQTGNVQTLVFPVMYLNESVLIDDLSAAKLHSMLLQSEVVTVIPFMIMGLGLLFGLIFIILVSTNRSVDNEASEAERAPLLKPT
uniref:lysosome membrane protein 2-like n=1 Tax=Pristiophorus japonicus TaxID=55135 RepID=UPI00398F43C6